MPPSYRQLRTRGFTLLEMAAVLLILSVIMGTGLTYLTGQATQEKHDLTLKRMAKIEEAIWQFRRARNRLPCPTDRELPTSDDNYGREVNSPGDCSAAGNYGDDSGIIRIGAVPHLTLGLPSEYAYDGWGRKFTYAVTIKLTSNGAFTTYPISSTSAGEIIIRDGSMDDSGSPPYGNDMTSASYKAAYVLLSHGRNGHGAYGKSGTRFTTPTVSNPFEQHNCHCRGSGGLYNFDDTIFIQKEMNVNTDSDRANYFDDIIHYKTRFQLYSPAQSGPTAETPPVTGFTGS